MSASVVACPAYSAPPPDWAGTRGASGPGTIGPNVGGRHRPGAGRWTIGAIVQHPAINDDGRWHLSSIVHRPSSIVRPGGKRSDAYAPLAQSSWRMRTE